MAVVDPVGAVLTQAPIDYGRDQISVEARLTAGIPVTVMVGIPASYELQPPIFDPYWTQLATQAVHVVGAGTGGDLPDPLVQRERDLARTRRYVAATIAEAWEAENAHRSSLAVASRQPAFHSLAALGPPALSEALRRLRGHRRPLWLVFLNNTVDARPAAGTDTVEDAASAWLAWGRRQGLIP